RLSSYSSPGVPDGVYDAQDFMLGAGMVIFQPATAKVVVVYDSAMKYWFLPKGRKDVNETLEEAVLREAYEESGYRAQFLPLYIPTNAPTPAEQRQHYPVPNTEPFFMSIHRWYGRRSPQEPGSLGGEYFVSWYIGQIPEDAIWEANTGMADEKGYRAYLLTREEARQKLRGTLAERLVERAYQLLEGSIRIQEKFR
ncbi:uncharacterized protein PHACADRAFT_61964, partial [Phanerochaete carnosa HHB-10118-sp]